MKNNSELKYDSLYDLSVDTDFLSVSDEYYNITKRMSISISDKLDKNIGCCNDTNLARYLNEWRDIKPLYEYTNYVMPQIEKKVFVHVPFPTDDPEVIKKGPMIYNDKDIDKGKK